MKPIFKHSFRWKGSWTFILLISCIGIWFLFFDTYSLLTRVSLEMQKRDLIERTIEYQEKTAELNEKIDELNNNPELLEKIAREEYGMQRPDETVFIIRTDQ